MKSFRDNRSGVVYEMDEHELPEHVTDYEEVKMPDEQPVSLKGAGATERDMTNAELTEVRRRRASLEHRMERLGHALREVVKILCDGSERRHELVPRLESAVADIGEAR